LPADWVYETFGAFAPASVIDRGWVVMSLAQLGRFADAADHEAEAIRLAESTHHPHTIGQAYLAASSLHLTKGDWAKGHSLAERWVVAARAGNIMVHLPHAVAYSALALAYLGELSEVVGRLREGEQLLEKNEAAGHRSVWIYRALARPYLVLGRLDDARRLLDRAAVVPEVSSQPGFAAQAQQLLGDMATHPDRFDPERGEAHYRQALALAEPPGMRPLVAQCHLGLGKLYRRVGERERAREHLATATSMYRAMDMPYWLEQAQAEVAELA
jgi:tetratricopeptide (TPR) repeat protein